MMTRDVTSQNWSLSDALPHLVNQGAWQRGDIARCGAQRFSVKQLPAIECAPPPGTGPGSGRFVPVAQDPTDPRTWQVPVVFT